jgi:DeoR/GlpR family transcriptional regulator of sugar metabolism
MPLTHNQRAILAAIEAGHITIRDIAQHTGIGSTATVHTNLRKLEKGGHLILHKNGGHTQVDAGRDFARGWDTAARLAGNPDA